MEELKGLIGASQMISTKMGLLVKEFGESQISRDEMSKEIDFMARELACICGTIKQVAYELKRKEAIAGGIQCK